jgi:hypothetical protein
MPDASQVRADLYAWGAGYGILTEGAMREAAGLKGNAANVPFNEVEADYFRTRRIMRIRLDDSGPEPVITIFTRQSIAARKVQHLRAVFAHKFAKSKITLTVATSASYKIDQTLQTYGQFQPLRMYRGRVACGSSVGIGNQRNAGTLTALATQAGSSELFGLSCNHVVGGCSTALPGTPIVVPGIQDVSADFADITVVGTHNSAARMSQGLPTVFDVSLNADLACFELTRTGQSHLTSWQGEGVNSFDTPTTFEPAVAPRLNVQKWGRSTGYTTGQVASVLTDPEPVEYSVVSHYGPQNSQSFRGTIYYPTVYEVLGRAGRPFSVGGDSGALVVTADEQPPRVVGIIIAGSPDKTLVLPLEPMLHQLELQLVSGHVAPERKR